MMTEASIGDDLYERDRDDADVEKMEAIKEQDEQFGTCQICELRYPIEDLDRVGGEWVCRQCEEQMEDLE